jgi:hypothetical protein
MCGSFSFPFVQTASNKIFTLSSKIRRISHADLRLYGKFHLNLVQVTKSIVLLRRIERRFSEASAVYVNFRQRSGKASILFTSLKVSAIPQAVGREDIALTTRHGVCSSRLTIYVS